MVEVNANLVKVKGGKLPCLYEYHIFLLIKMHCM